MGANRNDYFIILRCFDFYKKIDYKNISICYGFIIILLISIFVSKQFVSDFTIPTFCDNV